MHLWIFINSPDRSWLHRITELLLYAAYTAKGNCSTRQLTVLQRQFTYVYNNSYFFMISNIIFRFDMNFQVYWMDNYSYRLIELS